MYESVHFVMLIDRPSFNFGIRSKIIQRQTEEIKFQIYIKYNKKHGHAFMLNNVNNICPNLLFTMSRQCHSILVIHFRLVGIQLLKDQCGNDEIILT